MSSLSSVTEIKCVSGVFEMGPKNDIVFPGTHWNEVSTDLVIDQFLSVNWIMFFSIFGIELENGERYLHGSTGYKEIIISSSRL